MASARPDWYGLPTQAVWKAPPAPTDALPRGWSMEGQAQTVLGAVDPGLLGKTMMQEHLLVDLSKVAAVGPGAGPDGEYFWRLPAGDLQVEINPIVTLEKQLLNMMGNLRTKIVQLGWPKLRDLAQHFD
jgi:hypothetical protein